MNIKTFTIHSVRNVFAFFIALGLGYVAYTVSPSSVEIPKAEAGATQNVSGFAWSENVGWISLNSTSDGSTTSYGVNISPLTGTGTFSGYAWSENVGWITFNSGELSGCPSGTCNAQVDWVSGKVTGWARVLSQTGDGWIKLGGDGLSWGGAACTGVSDNANTNRCNYGVKITSGKFSGYAWGSDSVGWIDFAPLINGTTPLPSDDLAQIAPPACSASDPSTYTFTGSPCVATCVSGGGVTQENVPGNQYAQCFDLTVPAPVSPQACTTTLDCSNFAGSNPGTYIVGDNRCDADAGENSTNSLADCKPKTRFWQF